MPMQQRQLPGSGCFTCEVEQVQSGDDLHLLVSLGIDRLYKRVRARLYGVDTPDAYQEPPDSEAGRVRSQVQRLVKDKTCYVRVNGYAGAASDDSGWLVTLFLGPNEEHPCLNQILNEQGYVFR